MCCSMPGAYVKQVVKAMLSVLFRRFSLVAGDVLPEFHQRYALLKHSENDLLTLCASFAAVSASTQAAIASRSDSSAFVGMPVSTPVDHHWRMFEGAVSWLSVSYCPWYGRYFSRSSGGKISKGRSLPMLWLCWSIGGSGLGLPSNMSAVQSGNTKCSYISDAVEVQACFVKFDKKTGRIQLEPLSL
ncbi:hypothetical protein EJ03DRAFT_52535 [Teratosphaeria nubilosa]|uniref:Uncharacterized protein n=1 Tax=Teratosphaeria nubilosa TaxID=161662 RepID=A0A6G1KUK8_9PEZI|nr:hypothetical protein EJ03DRAFT_52535 [Teratosphaeria nubilosa]